MARRPLDKKQRAKNLRKQKYDRAYRKKNRRNIQNRKQAYGKKLRKDDLDKYLLGRYKTNFRTAIRIFLPGHEILNERTDTRPRLDRAISLFIRTVKDQPKKARKLVGATGLPNDCRLIEGKTASDATDPIQFIRAAMDEPTPLRY